MANYPQSTISLSDALTMELPYVTRVWAVPGLQVQNKVIPLDNANVARTFVMSHKDSKTCVGVTFTFEGNKGYYIGILKEYSELNIEILEKDFPELFKLTGNLFALWEE